MKKLQKRLCFHQFLAELVKEQRRSENECKRHNCDLKIKKFLANRQNVIIIIFLGLEENIVKSMLNLRKYSHRLVQLCQGVRRFLSD